MLAATIVPVTGLLLSAGTSHGAESVPPGTLRISGAGDLSGLDPHSRNEAFSNRILRQINEPLLRRDANLKLIPGLALSWSNPAPKIWQLVLRPQVQFANGEPFSANDVVFSVKRAQHEHSAIRHYAQGLGQVKAVNALTVEFDTREVNPVFLEQLGLVPMMSETWSRQQHCLTPANFRQKQETACTTTSNGTGAMRITQWRVGVQTRLERNPRWWGQWQTMPSNVHTVLYRPAASAASRLAGLLGADLDLIFDASPTEVIQLERRKDFQVLKATENRAVFFGFDQKSAQLRQAVGDTAQGNPLKLGSVRLALAQAIDHPGIQQKIYRGYATPGFSMLMPGAAGYLPDHDTHPARDETRARQLLREAGFPNGFKLSMGCPADRHPSDVALCSAVAAMWTRIGVQVSLVTLPKSAYFDKLADPVPAFDVYLMSWGGATTDASFTLGPLAHTANKTGAGADNYGGISNPTIDRMLDKAQSEMSPAARHKLLAQAMSEHQQQIHHLSMNRQMMIWAAREQVQVPMRADGLLDFSQLRLTR